jgi:GNAT superfamily N-acetyltransferase
MVLPDALAFERAGLKAWPGIEVEWDGAWVRRAANGYTKRANSLQCFDPADGRDAEARLQAGRQWFLARGLRPVIRMTPLVSAELDAVLDAQGWQVIDRSHLMAMPIGQHAPDPGGAILDVLDPAFLAALEVLQGYREDQMRGLRGVLSVIEGPAAGVVIYRDGQAAAAGLMALGDGILVTGNVITDRARRRQGLAAAMMHTGLAWAAGQGARVAALNVQADNAAAKALYAGLGYTHQYDYTYRIPGAA